MVTSDPARKEQVLDTFRAIYENEQSAKALTSSNKDFKEALAISMQVDKSEINDTYKYWKKRMENKKGDIGTVSSLMELLDMEKPE